MIVNTEVQFVKIYFSVFQIMISFSARQRHNQL